PPPRFFNVTPTTEINPVVFWGAGYFFYNTKNPHQFFLRGLTCLFFLFGRLFKIYKNYKFLGFFKCLMKCCPSPFGIVLGLGEQRSPLTTYALRCNNIDLI
ncbi:hypothetical protein ACVGV4_00915, partial [Enterobacter hormaechei]